jgi:hypothetical protein
MHLYKLKIKWGYKQKYIVCCHVHDWMAGEAATPCHFNYEAHSLSSSWFHGHRNWGSIVLLNSLTRKIAVLWKLPRRTVNNSPFVNISALNYKQHIQPYTHFQSFCFPPHVSVALLLFLCARASLFMFCRVHFYFLTILAFVCVLLLPRMPEFCLSQCFSMILIHNLSVIPQYFCSFVSSASAFNRHSLFDLLHFPLLYYFYIYICHCLNVLSQFALGWVIVMPRISDGRFSMAGQYSIAFY